MAGNWLTAESATTPTTSLSSVLYHAAQGGTQYAKYVEDAEREGDQELAAFFGEVHQRDAQRAQRAMALLASRQ